MDENKNLTPEEEPTILTLHDDEGNEEQFEFLDVIEYQDDQYIVLFPLEEEDMEIVILRVEEIEDPLMRDIRYLDKLVDELAKGKPMEKILRK